MKVINAPYKSPRKPRKQERNQFLVQWQQADMVYFRWFKRDTPACAFLNSLIDAGYPARIKMF
jgi:hypothetical protein